MLELLTQDAEMVSFPDCAITEFRVSDGRLSFVSDGIFVEGRGLVLAECHAELSSPSSIRSREYIAENWVERTMPSGLREICEWLPGAGDLRIAGFHAETGEWTEYLVPTFKMKIVVAAEADRP